MTGRSYRYACSPCRTCSAWKPKSNQNHSSTLGGLYRGKYDTRVNASGAGQGLSTGSWKTGWSSPTARANSATFPASTVNPVTDRRSVPTIASRSASDRSGIGRQASSREPFRDRHSVRRRDASPGSASTAVDETRHVQQQAPPSYERFPETTANCDTRLAAGTGDTSTTASRAATRTTRPSSRGSTWVLSPGATPPGHAGSLYWAVREPTM